MEELLVLDASVAIKAILPNPFKDTAGLWWKPSQKFNRFPAAVGTRNHLGHFQDSSFRTNYRS